MTHGWAIIEKTTKTERLWVSVDDRDGTTSKEWVTDGEAYRMSEQFFTVVRTRQTREVPA